MSRRFLLYGLTHDPDALLIDGDRVAAIGQEAVETAGDATRVDGSGLRAVPGFIELQINGAGDADVTTDPSSLWDMARQLPRHGVTAFLPTVVSSPRGSVEAALRALTAGPFGDEAAAMPIGLHVEGPFLAPARRGAHEERHLRDPDRTELEEWVAGGARIVTLAPERPGGIEAIEVVAAAGGIPSIGHTDADAGTAARAVDAGARYATHVFNAMPPLHHRTPGAAGVVLDDERVTVGVIGDGVHLDRRILRLVNRMAAGRVSLVSDAVGSRLGSNHLATTGDGARLDDGTLAGGTRMLDAVVRTFADATGSVEAALAAVTDTPARLLALDDGRGRLRAGGRADVTLLDAELDVVATLVGGRPAYLSDRLRWP